MLNNFSEVDAPITALGIDAQNRALALSVPFPEVSETLYHLKPKAHTQRLVISNVCTRTIMRFLRENLRNTFLVMILHVMAGSAGCFGCNIFDGPFFAVAIQTIPGVFIEGFQFNFRVCDITVEDFHRFGCYIG